MIRILSRRWYVAIPVALVALALALIRVSSSDTSALVEVVFAALGVAAVLSASVMADRLAIGKRRHARGARYVSPPPPLAPSPPTVAPISPPEMQVETPSTSPDSVYWYVGEHAEWPEADVVVDDSNPRIELEALDRFTGKPKHVEAVEIAVAIVSNGTVEELRRCLWSVPAAMDRLPYQLIVAEDGSDGEVFTLARSSHARVVRVAGEAGYAAAVNAMVATADSGPILLVDVNARLASRSGRRLYEALSRSEAGAVAPRIEGRIVHEGTGAGALLLSRRCIESFWPLDDSFFDIPSTTDLLHRIRERDVATVYEPDAVVTVATRDQSAPSSPLARRWSLNGGDALAQPVPDYLFFIGPDWRDEDHPEFQLALKASETRRVLAVAGWDDSDESSLTTPATTGGLRRGIRHVAKLIRHPADDHPDFAVMAPLGLPAPGRA